jgi:predicted O-methyltransferase YrrM
MAANSCIPRDECELIYGSAALSNAQVAIDVGMAFGVSTICLCDALRRNAEAQRGSKPRLIVMDPAQNWAESWRGVGLRQVKRGGFGDIVEFPERSSQSVLPELLEKGVRCQFAFIDGWHTFDHTLVDFFFVDKMLDIGGMIVLDDVGYPAINAACRFVLANRDYELVDRLSIDTRPPLSLRIRRSVKRRLAPIGRTNHSPSREDVTFLLALEGVHAIVVRKRGDDTRRFDHFRAF